MLAAPPHLFKTPVGANAVPKEFQKIEGRLGRNKKRYKEELRILGSGLGQIPWDLVIMQSSLNSWQGSTLGRVLGKERLDLIVVLKFPLAAVWKIDQKRAKQSRKWN